MDKRELFEKSLNTEPAFQEYEMDQLSMIGDFIGRHPKFFKKVYKAYKSDEESVNYEPDTGAPVSVIFDQELKQVVINRLKVEITFTEGQFLKFMELIDLCYSLIIPLGSVVSLDTDMMPESLKARTGDTNQDIHVMIIAQKIPLRESLEGFYADYMAALWPFGAQEQIMPIMVSGIMIKAVVHKGMTNEVEQEYKSKLKSTIAAGVLRSITYVTEDDMKKLEAAFATKIEAEIASEAKVGGVS